jgi:hypothetical protein
MVSVGSCDNNLDNKEIFNFKVHKTQKCFQNVQEVWRIIQTNFRIYANIFFTTFGLQKAYSKITQLLHWLEDMVTQKK